MTITIDKDRALSLLEQAVSQRGEDYVYPRETSPIPGAAACRYWHDESNEPGCIVGLALSLAGLSNENIAKLDGRISDIVYDAVLTVVGGMYITPEAAEAFQNAQHKQDKGHTWGVALRAAKGEQEALLA